MDYCTLYNTIQYEGYNASFNNTVRDSAFLFKKQGFLKAFVYLSVIASIIYFTMY